MRIILPLWLLFLLLVGSCKKEIAETEESNTTIHYLEGGTRDRVVDVSKVNDGGFIFCGRTGGGLIDAGDAFLMRVDGSGKKMWYKTYGTTNMDHFVRVIQCSDGGFMAVGSTTGLGKGTWDGTYAENEYVVKTNANGDVEWEKSYNGELISSWSLGVCEIYKNRFIIVGGRETSYASSISLISIDNTGYDRTQGVYTGLNQLPPFLVKPNYYHAHGREVTLGKDGNMVIAGVMSNANSGIESHRYLTYMLIINPSTGQIKAMYPYYDYIRESHYMYAFGGVQRRWPIIRIVPLEDGYLMATQLVPAGSTLRIQLMKTDLLGQMVWEKQYVGLGSAVFSDISQSEDGSLLITGASSAEKFDLYFPERFKCLKTMLMKVDMEGNEVWSQYSDNTNHANMGKCIQPDSEGGYNMAGYTVLNENGFDKMFVMKLDHQGKLKVK